MSPRGISSLAALALVAAAFGRAQDEPPLAQRIDVEIAKAWQREKIAAAPVADDATFLRRVYLDLCGIIPTYDETKRFLEDKDPAKRAKLIDRLLDDPRYAIHQADVWDLIMFTRDPPGFETSKRPGFQNWLREQFAKNTPYDQWVKAILQAEGNTVDDGPGMYYVQYDRRPEDATESITQTFLGVQLQCARCHDHPHADWKQKDFFGMAAFLVRLQLVEVGKSGQLRKIAIGEKNSGDIMFTGPAADAVPGKKGEPIKPKFLHGAVLDEPAAPEAKEVFPPGKMPPKPKFSRKDKLADWLTARDNPYFARAVANRVWGQFMGRGIIHPVDNLTQTQRASHPELLDLLAQQLAKHNFDLKWYIRQLCNSKTYQLAASGPTEEQMPRWYQRARVRPLSAEELLESWRVATGFDVVAKAAGKDKERFYGVTWDYMVRYFGTPDNGTGDFTGGLGEHLYMSNGQVNQLIVTEKGGLLDTLLKSPEPLEQRVDRLYLTTLNRPPRPEERKKFVEFLQTNDSTRVRDAIWALVTCSEFRFNH